MKQAPQDTLDHEVTGKTVEVSPEIFDREISAVQEALEEIRGLANQFKAFHLPSPPSNSGTWIERPEYTISGVTYDQYIKFRDLKNKPTDERIIEKLSYSFGKETLTIKEKIRIK